MFILKLSLYFVSLSVNSIEPKTGSFKNRAIVCHSIWESNSEENQRFGEMIGNHFHKIDSWCTFGEKILVHPKCKVFFSTLLDCTFFQYCNRYIGLYSIASRIVLILQVCDSNICQSNFITCLCICCRYSNYCDSHSCRSFSIYRNIGKINNLIVHQYYIGYCR